ncbi:relaxin-3 [Acomys russatus]|uniref:relaxin-3 n=1 Tax=Acomys russatus TaxID=60746 RepID=UPI0021E323EE|nr:relaxin-3 [Acomys russatus]
MATRGLLLLLLLELASWAVHGYLPDKTYEEKPTKTCGRTFIRRAIYVCGSPKRPWKEQDGLGYDDSAYDDSPGDFFSDGEAETNNQASELDTAVGSSEQLALTTPPQAFYSHQPSWQGSPAVIRSRRDLPPGLAKFCCVVGCTDSQILRFC